MDYVVSGGQVSPAGLVLSGTDTLTVLSGGTASGVTLDAGATEVISAGGAASGTVVNGGTEFVYAGGTATGTTVSAGYQAVYGSAIGTTADGGTINVSAGGSVAGSVIVNGGAEFIYRGGIASGTVLSDGNIYVSSAGHEVGATLSGGGVYVYKGGTDSGSVVSGGAALYVSSGGSASGTTVANGGSVNVTTSGTAAALAVQSGGTASAFTGGVVSDATVAGGGMLFAIGGSLAGSIANAGDVVFSLALSTQSTTFNGTLSGAGTLSVFGSGKLVLAGSDTLTGATMINYGSQLELTGAGAAGVGPIAFTTNSGTLAVDGAAPGNVISGFAAGGGDQILLNALTYTSGGTTSVGQSGDLVTVSTPTGSATLDIAGSHAFTYGGAAASGGQVVLTDSMPCFVGGTRIATPAGEVAVESIAAGDLVCVRGGGTARVEWVGHGASRITEENRSDIAPVIIRRGALGEGLPRRDLHLTRRHGVLVGEVLVPVELLVNDRSVVWDDCSTSVTFHHVELEGHDILLAEGAAAESFRDDGSQHLFPNVAGRRVGKAAVAPCVPVVTSGPLLEQAWRSVAACSGAVPDDSLTQDADLHLQHAGERIAAYRVEDGVHRFRLRGRQGGDVLLRSRHAIPASLQEGGDLRRLGVALAGIELGAAGGWVSHGAQVLRGGVHPTEAPGHRWTKGRATLPAELFDDLDGEIDVAVRVAGTVTYRASVLA